MLISTVTLTSSVTVFDCIFHRLPLLPLQPLCLHVGPSTRHTAGTHAKGIESNCTQPGTPVVVSSRYLCHQSRASCATQGSSAAPNNSHEQSSIVLKFRLSFMMLVCARRWGGAGGGERGLRNRAKKRQTIPSRLTTCTPAPRDQGPAFGSSQNLL